MQPVNAVLPVASRDRSAWAIDVDITTYRVDSVPVNDLQDTIRRTERQHLLFTCLVPFKGGTEEYVQLEFKGLVHQDTELYPNDDPERREPKDEFEQLLASLHGHPETWA